jgi:hypothetical protein
MARRKSKKSIARKVKRRTSARKVTPRKAKRGYAIHTGQTTGREVQAMHRLQVLTERYIREGLTPADARTRATEELRAMPREHNPLEVRKATLASIVAKASPGIRFNEPHGRRRPDRLRPCLQTWTRRHRLEAQGFCLPFRPLARLAQDEEPGGSGGEAGSGGGLGALTSPAGTLSAASHKTSTLRSPAFASSMILLAMISSLRSRGHLMAARAISNATPRRRKVSGSKFWPCKKGLMGTKSPHNFHFKHCETKYYIGLP